MQHAVKMPVLVAFVTKEDEGSKAVWPTVKQINKDYNGKIVVAKVLVEENKETADMCKATTVPTFQVQCALSSYLFLSLTYLFLCLPPTYNERSSKSAVFTSADTDLRLGQEGRRGCRCRL